MFSTRQNNLVVSADPKPEGSTFPGHFSFFERRPAISYGPLNSVAPFASLSAPYAGSQPAVESHTGVAFPSQYCDRSTFNCPTLTGLGVRAKRILGVKNINVYAVGIYVEAAAAKKALKKYRSQPTDELVTSNQLYDDVINSSHFDKSLRLVIHFNSLTRDKFLHALNERLVPELQKEGEAKLLSQFQKQFETVEFKKGLEIVFYQSGAGRLVTKINGSEVGVLESPELCRSLFRIYLGENAVAADARQDFGRNLAAMLKE